jgi:serine/threonine protein kinase
MRKQQQTMGGWELGPQIGEGGNAEVFRVTRKEEIGAMKILSAHHREPKRLARFRDEIEAMRRCLDIVGVLPVFDFGVPDVADQTQPWVVMGLAAPISEALGREPPLRRVVEAVRDIARVLESMQMHANPSR